VERVLTTKKGKSVRTSLTDQQALAKLAELPVPAGSFNETLLNARTLSHDMMVWVHILVNGDQRPKEKVGSLDSFTRIFKLAQSRLQRPKLTLMDTEGHAIVLSLASAESRNAGCIYVKSAVDATYFGKITHEGEFMRLECAPSSLAAYLSKFASDPEGEAAKYGKLTGRCCFCARRLTDTRSTDTGYGPICAEKWGLKWGA